VTRTFIRRVFSSNENVFTRLLVYENDNSGAYLYDDNEEDEKQSTIVLSVVRRLS